MGSDWNRAFRHYTEPDPLPEKEARRVAECRVVPRSDVKTWFDAYLGERYLGMVRVKLGGISECKLKPEDDARYCGDSAQLNSRDNRFSFAILGLRDLAGI